MLNLLSFLNFAVKNIDLYLNNLLFIFLMYFWSILFSKKVVPFKCVITDRVCSNFLTVHNSCDFQTERYRM